MKENLLKTIIFINEKDISFKSSSYFYKYISEKYHINAVNFEYGDLYKKIVQYQVKKYKQSLTYNYEKYSETGREKAIKVYQERYYRKKVK